MKENKNTTQEKLYDDESYYHIYNRGSDKRIVFVDEWDYQRFLRSLEEYNTKRNVDLRYNSRIGDSKNSKGSTFADIAKVEPLQPPENKLIEIFCYCLMPNHFHLILKSLVENGIAKFMQKLSTGYTMYFNKKHNRSGHLFQGRYKFKEIDKDFYFTYLTGYIHLNPVLANLVDSPQKYKYSSYLNYIGGRKTNFLKINEELLDIKIENYKQFITELKNDKKSLEKITSISLEVD